MKDGFSKKMNRNDRIIELWKKRAFPAYQGNGPYIYLSFDLYEIKEGLSFIDILNSLGCNVWYDEKMPDGRYWTSDICTGLYFEYTTRFQKTCHQSDYRC